MKTILGDLDQGLDLIKDGALKEATTTKMSLKVDGVKNHLQRKPKSSLRQVIGVHHPQKILKLSQMPVDGVMTKRTLKINRIKQTLKLRGATSNKTAMLLGVTIKMSTLLGALTTLSLKMSKESRGVVIGQKEIGKMITMTEISKIMKDQKSITMMTKEQTAEG